ncbi:MAG: DUF2269 domain-containing protein [Gammaproteobacteria bacterium]|nr:DUF2269 domain-containing protein [Gammaproteobacteria bacterium]
MNEYLWIKLLHILSAMLILGTGLGTAFFMFRAHMSRNAEAMRITTQSVVLADWIFTTPAVVIQFLTGFWLTSRLGIPYGSVWFVSILALFILVGLCWIPVVFIQLRIREIIRNGGTLDDYSTLMKMWIGLGIPAFASVLILIFLMVSKLGTDSIIFV